MKIKEYIDIVKELRKENLSEDLIRTIIEQIGLDNRTEFIAKNKREPEKASPEAKKYLKGLGYEGDVENLTKKECWEITQKLKEEQSYY